MEVNFEFVFEGISIVVVISMSKENYPKWLRKIKHTLIFNDLWDGIYEGENENDPIKPT